MSGRNLPLLYLHVALDRSTDSLDELKPRTTRVEEQPQPTREGALNSPVRSLSPARHDSRRISSRTTTVWEESGIRRVPSALLTRY